MATYNFNPVPAWGAVGQAARIGTKKSATFPVSVPGGGAATVVQGGTTKVGYIESDATGMIPAFTTTDIPSVVIDLGVGLVTVHSLEAISAGAASAASAATSATNAANSATSASNSAASASASASSAAATVNNRSIYVGDYGTLGTADDSATIEAALAAASGRRLVFPPNATLNTTDNTVTGISNATIDGNGCTLQLNATGARIAGLRLAGVCSNVQIERLRVKGNAVVADAHWGIGASGADLTDIRVVNCRVEDVTLGISFAADGAGSIVGLLYQGNHLKNIVGTTTGNGYGLHVAISGTTPADVRMIGNTVRSAQRHSIYQAKGRGVTIMGNTLTDHRDANKDGTILPALMLARSADVSIVGNSIIKPAGGGMFLGGVATGDHAESYTVLGNTLSDSQDAAVLVYIGQQDPATESFPTGVVFAHNTMKQSTARGCLQIFNGKQLLLSRNLFRCTDASVSTTALVLNAAGVTGNDYMDHVTVEGNLFDQAHASTVLMRFSPGHETDTTRYWFRGNRKVGAGLGLMFTSSASITNPNIDVQDQPRDGLSLSGVTTLASQVGGPTATTAPAAGGAGALPATPLGYLTVNVNGTDRKVAYY